MCKRKRSGKHEQKRNKKAKTHVSAWFAIFGGSEKLKQWSSQLCLYFLLFLRHILVCWFQQKQRQKRDHGPTSESPSRFEELKGYSAFCKRELQAFSLLSRPFFSVASGESVWHGRPGGRPIFGPDAAGTEDAFHPLITLLSAGNNCRPRFC